MRAHPSSRSYKNTAHKSWLPHKVLVVCRNKLKQKNNNYTHFSVEFFVPVTV